MIAWLLNALAQGAMIALVALGYTMVYGVLRLINFAHSEVLMMSAYASVIAQTSIVCVSLSRPMAPSAPVKLSRSPSSS